MQDNKFPIVGHIETEAFGIVPLLGIRMMDGEREKELMEQSAQAWKEAHGQLGSDLSTLTYRRWNNGRYHYSRAVPK